MCEAGICHTLLSILRGVAQLYHLLGLFFTTPPQLCRMISWNHTLIWRKLDGHNSVSNIKRKNECKSAVRIAISCEASIHLSNYLRSSLSYNVVTFLSFVSRAIFIDGPEVYPMTYLTAVLLNFMEYLVEIFIELFKLEHCGSVSLLEI